jgi:hypothetical protein
MMTATVPAGDFASVGSAQVTVVNAGPGGGTSGARAFSITAPPAATTWARAVAGIGVPQDIVCDSAHGKLYVSVASTDPLNPSTIVPINPGTGITGTPIAAGNNPNRLSISSDSSYPWAGLDGDNSVPRYLLPSLTNDISFPVLLDWLGRPLQAVSSGKPTYGRTCQVLRQEFQRNGAAQADVFCLVHYSHAAAAQF